MSNISRYQLWLVAQNLAKQIEEMNSPATPSSLVIIEHKSYMNKGHVNVSVDWPWQTIDEGKRAWAQRFVGRHGGTLTEENPGHGTYNYLEIKGEASHGIPYTLHVATIYPPAQEQDGDEAQS
ncbi:hypothetical protein SEA_HITCHHIKER_19 [Microbacterium phage HitchHiker]